MPKKIHNLFNRTAGTGQMGRPKGAGNFDNMDDYNIVGSLAVKQGTIQHTPTADKDIANKKYVDDSATAPAGNALNVQINDGAGNFYGDDNFIYNPLGSPKIIINGDVKTQQLVIESTTQAVAIDVDRTFTTRPTTPREFNLETGYIWTGAVSNDLVLCKGALIDARTVNSSGTDKVHCFDFSAGRTGSFSTISRENAMRGLAVTTTDLGGDYNCAEANWDYDLFGMDFTVRSTADIDHSGAGTTECRVHGINLQLQFDPNVIDSGSVFTGQLYGIKISPIFPASWEANSTYYGLYNDIDQSTTSWFLYNASISDNYMGEDNSTTMWGTTNTDLQISSDGTNGVIDVNAGITGTAIKDEDDMSSDSAVHLATQQSIKKYVDDSGGGSATKEFFIPSTSFSTEGEAVLGQFLFLSRSNGQNFRCNFMIPTDFTSLTGVYVVVIPDTTETIQWDVATSFATVGEAYTTHTDSITNATLAVTVNQIAELDCSAAFTGISASDYVGFNFTSNTSYIRAIGIRVKYS